MGETVTDYASAEELAIVSFTVGAIFVVEGIAGIVVGIGTLQGKRWAWKANIVFAGIPILLAIGDILGGLERSTIGLVINGFILAFLFTRPVRAYFGRSASQTLAPETNVASGPTV